MHGKPSIQKTMRGVRHAGVKKSGRNGSYMEVGSWRFEENEDGDLVIINVETRNTVILIQK